MAYLVGVKEVVLIVLGVFLGVRGNVLDVFLDGLLGGRALAVRENDERVLRFDERVLENNNNNNELSNHIDAEWSEKRTVMTSKRSQCGTS
jgi:hypothetical protein